MNPWPALAVALGLLACGDGVLRLARVRDLPPGLRFAAATVAGSAVSMLALYASLLLTGTVAFAPLAVLHGVALVAVLPRLPWRRLARPTAPPRWSVAALVAALLFVAVGASRPFYSYDSKAIYGLKAKALLAERDLAGPLFQDVDVVHYHGDYPLGLPLLMAYTGWLTGEASTPADSAPAADAAEWIARHDAVEAYTGVTLLWVLAFVALLSSWAAEVAGRTGTRPGATTGATTDATTGATTGATTDPRPGAKLDATSDSGDRGAPSTQRRAPAPWWLLVIPFALVAPWDVGASWRTTPELPLALCLGVATALCLRRPTRGATLLVGLAAVAALLLKQDALIGAASLGAALLVHGRGDGRWRHGLGLAAGLAVGLVAVAAVKASTAGAPYDEHYLQALRDGSPADWLARLAQLPAGMTEALGRTECLAFWLFVIVLAIPLGRRGDGPRRTAALALSLHLVLCLAVFVVTPNVVAWHLRTALARVWTQMAGAACLLALAAWRDLLTPAPARRPESGDAVSDAAAVEAGPGPTVDASVSA